jgi:fido (protein-threonine AMPylation protein)
MVGRSETAPGEFKLRANRAGATELVDPSLVEGTLERAFDRYASLPVGFARAVFALFLVAEVHPFADGNGRVARALANAELTTAGEQRLIVPTVFRDDYLQALRALSRTRHPAALVRVADRAQAWTYEVDFSTLESARADLEATNALLTPEDAGARGAILRLPSEIARSA